MGKFGWFVAGGLIGAGAALMLSPRTGEENREMVLEYANSMAGNAQNYGQRAASGLQSSLSQAAEVGRQAVTNIQGAAESAIGNAATSAADKNDELRAKIEAARERIAAQVQENAAQSAASANSVIDKAADKVEGATEKVADSAKKAVDSAAEAAEKVAKKASKASE